MKKYAVIDLGSNTFHLLIVEKKSDNTFETLFRKRVFTGLSDGGIDVIKEDRINYGLETISEFKRILASYDFPTLRVVGTAVLRKAANRQMFIDQANKILEAEIEIIDGDTEADYIFKGIMLLEEMKSGTHLIMDIGGGSTEFILIQDGIKLWSKSFQIGVGVLHQSYHNTEPINETDLRLMKSFILNTVADLIPIIDRYKPSTLTGASGSFEVLQSMSGFDLQYNQLTSVSTDFFYNMYDSIISLNYEQREKLKGLPKERVKLIVVGMVLKKIICDLIQPGHILVSPYALKEGILSEMIKKD
jgi:exopolyphosphatase/guanosine-5'-triphosphate,3'-diphosphate pyrophosphatase